MSLRLLSKAAKNRMKLSCIALSLLGLLLLAGCAAYESEVYYSDQEASASGYSFSSQGSTVDTDGIRRELVNYNVDGLTQYALILWPRGQAPEAGWPLVIFNHGFHPDPPNHGRIDGEDARPGAYYWDLPQSYVAQGYVVLAPDYRGHNVSEGSDFVEMANAAAWYTRDVVAAYYAALKLKGVDGDSFYMSGHSMGGGITQRAVQVLGSKLKAAAIWSTSFEDLWHYERVPDLDVPVIIHHGRGDQSTAVENTLSYVEQLDAYQKPHQAFIYETDNHLFGQDFFDQAILRDVSWFEQNR